MFCGTLAAVSFYTAAVGGFNPPLCGLLLLRRLHYRTPERAVSPVLVRGKVSQTPTPFPTPLSPLNRAGPTRVVVCSVERIRGEGHSHES